MSHEESFEEESSDGSTKLTHSIFSGPSEDYTCALNNGVKALVGDWSGLLGDSLWGDSILILGFFYGSHPYTLGKVHEFYN